jgi:hypothetical protein
MKLPLPYIMARPLLKGSESLFSGSSGPPSLKDTPPSSLLQEKVQAYNYRGRLARGFKDFLAKFLPRF